MTWNRRALAPRPTLILGVLVLLAGDASALTFPVTKTADTVDGTCDADCSLREAIIAANANGGPDVITLPAGTYNLAIAPGGESIVANNAAVGDLDISGELTINGAAAATTIVDGQDLSRIFHIHAGPVTINNLTARNGTEEAGGGIFIAAITTVNLTNVVVTGFLPGSVSALRTKSCVSIGAGWVPTPVIWKRT